MRSFYIVRKETKAFIKDWKSLLLLFITPIILVLIVGSAFILTTPTNISILICSSEDTEIYKSVVTLTNRSEIFSVKSKIAPDCREKVNNAIRTSEIKAGVIVSSSSNINTKLEVITDNSKLISDFITSYFRIISNDISDRIVTQYIAKIYTDIESVKRDMNTYESVLIQEKNDLTALRIRISSAKEQLNFLKGKVGQFQSQDADSIINNINSVLLDLNNFKSTTNSAVIGIDSASSAIQQSNMSEPAKSSVAG